MRKIISFDVMPQEKFGTILVQDIQSMIQQNPERMGKNFPGFCVDNLPEIVLLFIDDVKKYWSFVDKTNQDKLLKILEGNSNHNYRDQWDGLKGWISGQNNM